MCRCHSSSLVTHSHSPYPATDTELRDCAATRTRVHLNGISSCGLTSEYVDILQHSSVLL